MCLSAAALMALSAGVTVAGQLQQGRANRAMNNAQAAQYDTLAAQQREQGEAEAKRIRREAERTRGAARAQLAANGIDVDSGSAVLIDEDIVRRSEDDAFNVLLTGERQGGASNFAARQSRAAGANAYSASVLGAVSTGLQGWKGVKQPARDPIGDFYQRGTRGSGD